MPSAEWCPFCTSRTPPFAAPVENRADAEPWTRSTLVVAYLPEDSPGYPVPTPAVDCRFWVPHCGKWHREWQWKQVKHGIARHNQSINQSINQSKHWSINQSIGPGNYWLVVKPWQQSAKILQVIPYMCSRSWAIMRGSSPETFEGLDRGADIARICAQNCGWTAVPLSELASAVVSSSFWPERRTT